MIPVCEEMNRFGSGAGLSCVVGLEGHKFIVYYSATPLWRNVSPLANKNSAHLRSNSQIYQSDALALAKLCMSVFYLHMPNHSTVLFIEVQVVWNLVNQFMSDTPKCQRASNLKVESNYTGSIFIRVCEHFSCNRSFVMRHACVTQGFIFRAPPPSPRSAYHHSY
jgi:hypothetical protein